MAKIRGRRIVLPIPVLQEFLAKQWGRPTEFVFWERDQSNRMHRGYALVRPNLTKLEQYEQRNHIYFPEDVVYRTKDGVYHVDFDYLSKGMYLFDYLVDGYAMHTFFKKAKVQVSAKDNYPTREDNHAPRTNQFYRYANFR